MTKRIMQIKINTLKSDLDKLYATLSDDEEYNTKVWTEAFTIFSGVSDVVDILMKHD